ncbi:MAG TPA: YggS family pyridoxal phosphate-dependent enzyme [Candidatus Egerieousia sp.]|nr:YggS family pyridoxal phosphate-dependent enzyme [Candidatus Egerieousia sp.]HPT06336.1 YggS family pyridoxal phosphate-dependent enzyme [Candidatus Egerieousia sp.]
MSIASEILELKKELPQETKLVAISKFHAPEKIIEAYNEGQRIFGESRPQELADKVKVLPTDIEWHFIGHLQSNKIKMVVPYVKLIHSVDTEKLLYEIDGYAERNNLHANCLLEMFIAREQSKQGFSYEEVSALLEKIKGSPLKNTTICGLMGMATFTEDQEEIKREFIQLKECFLRLQQSHPELSSNFKEISMGMTEDYKIAIQNGSTLVRIGTKIFGPREY